MDMRGPSPEYPPKALGYSPRLYFASVACAPSRALRTIRFHTGTSRSLVRRIRKSTPGPLNGLGQTQSFNHSSRIGCISIAHLHSKFSAYSHALIVHGSRGLRLL